jgi:mono/diheme cytochrome c family protein
MKEKLHSVGVTQMVSFVRAFKGGRQVVRDDSQPDAEDDRPPSAENVSAAREAHIATLSPDSTGVLAQPGMTLFQRSCAMCHGPDGKGAGVRPAMPAIPDFSLGRWQERRTDSRLMASILDGKGTGMPSFGRKLAREQARELVSYVRAFAPAAPRRAEPAADDFEARLAALRAEFEDVGRQIRALSPAASNRSLPRTQDPAPRESPPR